MQYIDIFTISVERNKLKAYIELNENRFNKLLSEYSLEEIKQSITASHINELIQKYKITYGIKEENFDQVIQSIGMNFEPIEIATGTPPVNGEDGYVNYYVEATMTLSIEQKGKVDFKEVMQIPKAEVGDKLATIIPPTNGTSGKDVFGKIIPAKKGKVARLIPGKNTKLVEEEMTIYATNSGQVSAVDNKVNVLPIFEVNQDLDLSIGNIDFNGSIVIRGDVPNGFSLKARGDIQVFGLVEAAHIEAGGSVFVNEGISGLGKGKITAGLDIHVGNVNQGILEAGRDILIDKSALHSQIIAREVVYCKTGHIIGGSISAGRQIIGHDIGNRLSTQTLIYLGENKKVLEEKTRINKEMDELLDQIKKLEIIGENLKKIKSLRPLKPNEETMLQRQQQSMKKLVYQLNELEDRKEQLIDKNDDVKEVDQIMLKALGIVYPNVTVICGKYSYRFQSEYKYVSVVFQGNDFNISTL